MDAVLLPIFYSLGLSVGASSASTLEPRMIELLRSVECKDRRFQTGPPLA